MRGWFRGVVLGCALSGLLLAQAGAPGLMKPAEVQKALPATVFFRGLSAPVQARNSGGILFLNNGEKRMMLVSLVDTSGYSTSVQEKYQAYLLTEVQLDIGGHKLMPGAYGCGFVSDDKFIVQDIGAHDLFMTASVKDSGLKRPTPLQILAGPNASEYRLYAGRSFVTVKASQ